ncbi:MAG: hypothetical protein IPK13_04765 [Deltaproteobacteria bacterium]|nr:hypothetical protein [Deltaproteobacteria bacterium]
MATISGFGVQATLTASITLDGLGASHVMDHLTRLQSASYLGALFGGFSQLNHAHGMRGLAQAYESGFMAGAMSVGSPSAARCPCGHLYGQSRTIDLANTTLNRLGAMRFEEYLKRRPEARAEVEMRLGGRIHFGATDGVIKVTPFTPGTARALRLGADSPTLRVMEMFGNMDRAAMSCGLSGGAAGGHPYMSFLAAGLAQVASGALSGSGGGGYAGGGAYANGGGSYGFNDRGGDGEGPYQSRFGMGPMGEEADAILNDPSLEMTDKILLFLMAVVKKIDDDLEKQMKKVNDLQQQANKDVGGKSGGKGGGKGGGGVSGAGGGKGGKGGGGGADGKKEGSPSVDMETMKLKRMVDKRSNIFDALRSIIDRIQQLAKAVSDFSR